MILRTVSVPSACPARRREDIRAILPLVFTVFVFTSILAAGCNKEEPSDSSRAGNAGMKTIRPQLDSDLAQPDESSAALQQEVLDGVGKADQPYRLALVVKTRNNPFFDPMIKAAEAEAKALGVELEVQSPAQETDKERQFAIVQDLVAKGLDAILIAPADSRGIVPALKQAQDKNVLIVNLDNRVDSSTAQSAGLTLGGYVGADNEAGGRLAGEAMVKELEARREGGVGPPRRPTGPKGTTDPSQLRGKVAILEGIRGVDNAEARKRGFESAVLGKLEVVARDTAEWETPKAYAKFQAMLAAHKDIDGVFCANDKMALGAIKAAKEAGRIGRITAIGYDNIPDVKSLLKNGDMFATIEQHPDLMGKYGVRMAVGILQGKLEKGKDFLVPLEVVRGK